MTILKSSRLTSMRSFHFSAGFVLRIAGFLWCVLLPLVSYAQHTAPSGEEVYFDRFGCWNCHGKAGEEGGIGPIITKSQLPLRKFVGYVRLPGPLMPRYASLWASDAELAMVYHWLRGIDAIRTPPPITMDLNILPGADGQAKEVELELVAVKAQSVVKFDVPDPASLHYRVTLMMNGNAPVANQTLEYRRTGGKEWSKLMTDEHGEALLAPDRGFIAADARGIEKARARLRVALTKARMVVVVEALDYTEPAKLVVLGIGTAILKEQ